MGILIIETVLSRLEVFKTNISNRKASSKRFAGNQRQIKQHLSKPILAFVLGSLAFAITPKLFAYQAKSITNNLVNPWGMVFLDSQNVLVTERIGSAKLVNITTGKQTNIKNLPKDIIAKNQGGLLDVQVSNTFKQDGWIYFSYAQGTEDSMTTRVSRAKLKGDALIEWQHLITATPYTSKVHHFGSRLAFNSKNQLFITVGDRGERDRAQDLSDHAGTVLRINPDGSIPNDNPFANDKDDNTLAAIYSYGHRNPQGLWIMENDEIWTQEHGPRGGDELNKVVKGDNYGWPVITYGKEYWGPSIGEGTKKTGMTQPHYYYVPSIAPSGLAFYKGDRYPELKGRFLIGALKDRHINVLSSNDGLKTFKETRILENLNKRVRDIEIGPDGKIYFLTDSPEGELMELMPK